MRNKIKLKKLLIILICILFFFSSLFLIINTYEYHMYNKNYNYKISSIINKIQEKYPNISEKEIIEIINNENDDNELLLKYSVNLDSSNLIKNNQKLFYKFSVINILFYVLTIFLIILLFLNFNKRKDNEIKKITKYIEQINKKNYKIDLDDMSEDELSILKNEIYKTTINLKELAELNINDKKELKKSLSDISHQLKTPLTSINIILDNLQDDSNMDINTRKDFIKDIKREINSISFLIQSILKLSKIDTNTLDFNREEVSIKKIVNESIKNVSMLSDLKNVKVIFNCKEDFNILCDYKWQIEALSNIIKNCIEYSSKVNITTEDNKVYSQIIVSDDGKGIDKEDLPHIFERFYKGKNSTYDSVGIGLSLAKSIIEIDKGKISVESNDNGTTFIIKYFK